MLSSAQLDLICDAELQRLEGISETLNLMVTYIRFEARAALQPELHTLMAQLHRAASDGVRALLESLWAGDGSLVQRHLLRQQAAVHIWPSANTALAGRLQLCLEQAEDSPITQAISNSGTSLTWRPSATTSGDRYRDHKENVVNAPFLAALCGQLGVTQRQWPDFDVLVELRQIRSFDPSWFDLSCMHAFKLTLAASHAVDQAKQRPPVTRLRRIRPSV
jgi:hypothetical protein